jgi:hypothetical protein
MLIHSAIPLDKAFKVQTNDIEINRGSKRHTAHQQQQQQQHLSCETIYILATVTVKQPREAEPLLLTLLVSLFKPQ